MVFIRGGTWVNLTLLLCNYYPKVQRCPGLPKVHNQGKVPQNIEGLKLWLLGYIPELRAFGNSGSLLNPKEQRLFLRSRTSPCSRLQKVGIRIYLDTVSM